MSKLLSCLFWLGLVILQYSCDVKKENVSLLAEADSLMSVDPDSALIILRNFEIRSEKPSVIASYALLLTQAEDKNYILHENDSLIKIAVRYYDSIGDVRQSAKSHYYLGRVYQDMHNEAMAIREFSIALSLVEQHKDSLLCLIYGNLGQIYFQQNLLDKADSLFLLSENIAIQEKDTFNIIMGMVARANVSLQEKEYSNAMTFLEHALVHAKKIHNANAQKIIFNSMAAFYTSMGCHKKTIEYSNQGLICGDDSLSSARLYLLQGNALAHLEKYDSAEIVICKSLHFGSLYTKAISYLLLSDIKEKQGALDEALRYQDSYIECLDSIKIDEDKVAETNVLEKDFFYRIGYQKLVDKYKKYMYGLLAFVVLLIAYRMNEHKKIRILINKKKELEAKVAILSVMQEELKKKERELKILHEFSGSVEQDKAMLYILTNQVLILKQSNKDFFLKLLSNTKSYKMLLLLIQKKKETPRCKDEFSEKDWEVFLKDVDYFSNGFVEKLKKHACLLSNNDIRFCCLFKIGLNYGEMALVFGRTLDAMYKKRNAILENKLTGLICDNTFEDFVNSI